MQKVYILPLNVSDIDSSFSLTPRGSDCFFGHIDREVARCLVIIVYSTPLNVMHIHVFNVIGTCTFKKTNPVILTNQCWKNQFLTYIIIC